MPETRLSYCVSSLLFGNANIKLLVVRGAEIDVSEFKPPPGEPTDTVFPGLLNALDHGLGFILGSADVSANIALPNQQRVDFTLSGGDIEPDASGSLKLRSRFEGGDNFGTVTSDATVSFAQLSGGRFASLRVLTDINAALVGLPEPEVLSLDVLVKASGDERGESHCAADPETMTDEPTAACLSPESVQITLEQFDGNGLDRMLTTLDGTYDGNLGEFSGTYELETNERLAQRYVGEQSIPAFTQNLSGSLNFNIAALTGDITIASDFTVDDLRDLAASEAVPQLLTLHNDLHIYLLPNAEIRVTQLDGRVSDDANSRALSARLTDDLQIPLNDVDGFLHQDVVLLEFDLPGIPLRWFNFLLADQEITAGLLTGGFSISTDENAVLHLTPQRALRIEQLSIVADDQIIVDKLEARVNPSFHYDRASLQVTLDDLKALSGDTELASLQAQATVFFEGSQAGNTIAALNGEFAVHELISLLNVVALTDLKIPEHLKLDLNTIVRQGETKTQVTALNASITEADGTQLLQAALLQPLPAANETFENARGDIARLAISAIELDWFSAFIPDMGVAGRLTSAEFILSVAPAGEPVIKASKPLRLRNFNLTTGSNRTLNNLDIRVSPNVVLTESGTRIGYKGLRVSSAGNTLVSGRGVVTLNEADTTALAASGKISIDIEAVAQQPVIAEQLEATLDGRLSLDAEYRLEYSESGIDISRLKANVYYDDEQPRVSLATDSGIHIQTALDAGQSELGRARGQLSLNVNDLTPGPFAGMLSEYGVSFGDANGRAVLTSADGSLRFESTESLTVRNIRISGEEGEIAPPVNLSATLKTTLSADELVFALAPASLSFVEKAELEAIGLQLSATVQNSAEQPSLKNMKAALTVQLPVMLEQLQIMPGHRMLSGALNADVALTSEHDLISTVRIDQLMAGSKLPIDHLTIDVRGSLVSDGGFSVTGPLAIVGVTGTSDMAVNVDYAPQENDENVLHTSLTSTALYLNDLLSFISEIAPEQAVPTGAEEKDAELTPTVAIENGNLEPDEQAFWDLIPYTTVTDLSIDQLHYTEFLIIRDINGRIELASDKLELSGFESHFHESPMKLDIALSFTPGTEPYSLVMNGSIEDFDLATFQQELEPESTPRAVGLFNMHLQASGQSPNVGEYRNRLSFDVQLRSEDGQFRLLNPDSAMVAGSTELLGKVGEGISYVPTGLFGLGAAARLAEYIKVIDYDEIDVHLIRGLSKDIEVERYEVRNKELRMTATGGIQYQPGVDVASSPLELEGQLNFLGRGAAIMYDLNLLQDTRDEKNYWKGPQIRFTGSAINNTSNLESIVSTASDAALKGGVTRPISGLIGNIKYRWFGDDARDENSGAAKTSQTPSQ